MTLPLPSVLMMEDSEREPYRLAHGAQRPGDPGGRGIECGAAAQLAIYGHRRRTGVRVP